MVILIMYNTSPSSVIRSFDTDTGKLFKSVVPEVFHGMPRSFVFISEVHFTVMGSSTVPSRVRWYCLLVWICSRPERQCDLSDHSRNIATGWQHLFKSYSQTLFWRIAPTPCSMFNIRLLWVTRHEHRDVDLVINHKYARRRRYQF